MLDLRPEDIIHKSHLHRLLMEIVDQPLMAQTLAFKGGTCAPCWASWIVSRLIWISMF